MLRLLVSHCYYGWLRYWDRLCGNYRSSCGNDWHWGGMRYWNDDWVRNPNVMVMEVVHYLVVVSTNRICDMPSGSSSVFSLACSI